METVGSEIRAITVKTYASGLSRQQFADIVGYLRTATIGGFVNLSMKIDLMHVHEPSAVYFL